MGACPSGVANAESDQSLLPAAFSAWTSTSYSTPFVSPVMVCRREVKGPWVIQEPPSGRMSM